MEFKNIHILLIIVIIIIIILLFKQKSLYREKYEDLIVTNLNCLINPNVELITPAPQNVCDSNGVCLTNFNFRSNRL
jgi:hypothetical protein